MSNKNTKPSKWSKKAIAIFVDVLSTTGNVSAACRAAGVSRMSAYHRRSSNEEFANSWADAIGQSLDDLEFELRRRAVEGTDKPVYYGGEKVGDVKSYNDNLGMFLLRARRRDVVGEGAKAADGTVSPMANTDDVRSRLLAKLDALTPRDGE